MPGARATARKSSSSSRKTIAKAERVTKYTNARYRDESGTLSGNQVSRLLKRGIALYWQERTQERLCAEGGEGRKRDREDYEEC